MANCKHCKAKSAPLKINLHSFCDYDCATAYAKSVQDKARAKKQAESRKEDREKLKSLKTNSEHASECQQLFNKMRRLEELLWFKERGIEPYCISCQLPLGNDQWACGHFKTRKARSDLAFDRMNTFLQHNVRCNKHLSGDIEGYKKGLAIRFGEDEAGRIIEYCEVRQETPKRTAEDWRDMKKQFSAEIRRLQKLLDS
jgi:hypothetical protein